MKKEKLLKIFLFILITILCILIISSLAFLCVEKTSSNLNFKNPLASIVNIGSNSFVTSSEHNNEISAQYKEGFNAGSNSTTAKIYQFNTNFSVYGDGNTSTSNGCGTKNYSVNITNVPNYSTLSISNIQIGISSSYTEWSGTITHDVSVWTNSLSYNSSTGTVSFNVTAGGHGPSTTSGTVYVYIYA